MPSAARLASALLLVAACRTNLLDGDFGGDGGAGADAALTPDLAVPPDLARASDLICEPPPPASDGGVACPCGMSGLCRPATGRLSVQTQSNIGQLRILVMDDNGCNRHDVGSDQPVGVPRWAPDRERLAFISAGAGEATLHVIRVDRNGTVVCRDQAPLGGFRAGEVAWLSNDELWLFSTAGFAAEVMRWKLGVGPVATQKLPADRFDAVGEGPLVTVQPCGMGCAARVMTRAQVLGAGPLTELYRSPVALGPIHLAPSGDRAVFEVSGLGWDLLPLTPAQPMAFGKKGDRSPSFAHGGASVVYTTDGGELRYHFLVGPEADSEVAIPSSWSFVYSPDWSGLPGACAPARCF